MGTVTGDGQVTCSSNPSSVCYFFLFVSCMSSPKLGRSQHRPLSELYFITSGCRLLAVLPSSGGRLPL